MPPTESMSSQNFAEKPKSSVPTTLFDDNMTENVLDCITGEVIGVRPRHVDTVDVHRLPPSDHSELDRHRKLMFGQIFHKRVWGKNLKVKFSASGKPITALCCQITNSDGLSVQCTAMRIGERQLNRI